MMINGEGEEERDGANVVLINKLEDLIGII